MPSIRVEFLLKDELQFEVKARGAMPQSDVASLRRQLRELMAEEAAVIPFQLRDWQAELELIEAKWEDLQSLGIDLESVPRSSGGRLRLEQRLQHLSNRVVNMEAQTSDQEKLGVVSNLKAAIQVELHKRTVVESSASAPHSPASVDVAGAGRGWSGHSSTSSGMVAAAYQPLPNPLYSIVKSLPEVDGLNETLLLQFFGKIFRMSDFSGVSDETILQLIFPYSRGPMAELVTRIMHQGGSLDSLHRETLDTFIPGRLREQLRQKYFYRVQAHDESLALFITSIRDAARVLRIDMPEREIVQVILEGVTPQERSRLVFAERPQGFDDLHRLCVMSRSIQMADETRLSSQSRERSDNPHNPPQRQRGLSLNRRRGDDPVCFHCRQPGHLMRSCPSNGRGPASLSNGAFNSKNGVNRGR